MWKRILSDPGRKVPVAGVTLQSETDRISSTARIKTTDRKKIRKLVTTTITTGSAERSYHAAHGRIVFTKAARHTRQLR